MLLPYAGMIAEPVCDGIGRAAGLGWCDGLGPILTADGVGPDQSQWTGPTFPFRSVAYAASTHLHDGTPLVT